MENKLNLNELSSRQEACARYAEKIIYKVSEMLSDELLCELREGDNLTYFFHALATVVPVYFYDEFTGKNCGFLEFNHIANSLIFQYSENKN
ncbi:MAG: hypothetical protein ACRC9X_06365 [Bacteroidales bacterium]